MEAKLAEAETKLSNTESRLLEIETKLQDSENQLVESVAEAETQLGVFDLLHESMSQFKKFLRI